MEKRVVIAVVVSLAILFAWQAMVQPPPQQRPDVAGKDGGLAPGKPAGRAAGQGTDTAAGATRTGEPGGVASAGAGTGTGAAMGTGAPAGATASGTRLPAGGEAPAGGAIKGQVEAGGAAAAGDSVTRAAAATAASQQCHRGERTVIDTRLYRAELSSCGAALVSFRLKDPQYQEVIQGKLSPVDLVRTGTGYAPLSVRLEGGEVVVSEGAPYRLVKKTPAAVTYAWEGGGVRVEKEYQFTEGSYVLNLGIGMVNLGAAPLSLGSIVRMVGWQDPAASGGSLLKPSIVGAAGICNANGKITREAFASLLKEPKAPRGDVRFAGIDEKYFLLAVIPEVDAHERQCNLTAAGDGRVEASLGLAERQVPPGGRVSLAFAAYVGPKVLGELDAVTAPKGGGDPKLGDAVDYGWFEVLSRPMLWLLKAFHGVTRNWGIAIILLTLVVKLLTLYWSQKSMLSMKGMQQLKPKMDQLRERFADDKQRLNTEVMNLYKTHRVNPLGGCLPMLIQMPIYFALYSTLSNSVELYRSSFALWIDDLAAPDRYFIMPAVLGASMFVQQKISPTPMDSSQAKMMMYMMPAMFTFFMLFLPSGLTLYILTNTLLSMGHQWYFNRMSAGPVPAPASAPTPPKSKSKSKGKGKAR